MEGVVVVRGMGDIVSQATPGTLLVIDIQGVQNANGQMISP
jgi:hypothetical protein